MTYVAFSLKGGKASCVLGVLVRPEDPVGVVLGDPVLVHVGEEIKLAIGRKPLVDGLARVGRDGRAIGLSVGGVGRGLGVILAGEVAVLRVGACENFVLERLYPRRHL